MGSAAHSCSTSNGRVRQGQVHQRWQERQAPQGKSRHRPQPHLHPCALKHITNSLARPTPPHNPSASPPPSRSTPAQPSTPSSAYPSADTDSDPRPKTAASSKGGTRSTSGHHHDPGTPVSGTPGGTPSNEHKSASSYFSLPRSVSRKKSTSNAASLVGLSNIQISTPAGYTPSEGKSGLGAKMFNGKGGQVVQSANVMYENVHEIATKRIATLDYLRRAHEGRVYWFNTVFFSKSDLVRSVYGDTKKLGRRSTNYFILGISIPNILDLGTSSPLDYLRAFNQLLSEYESYQSSTPSSTNDLSYSHTAPSSSRRLPKLFSRSAKTRRGSSAAITAANWSTSEITLVGVSTPTEGGLERVRSASGSASTISGPIPIVDSSDNLHSLLPPSLPTHTTPSLAGTGLGTPGIDNDFSFLSTPSLPFEPDFFETFATLCDVLIDAYSRVLSLVANPENCGPGVGEMFVKADLKVRKNVIGVVVREFEEASRGSLGVRGEVGSLGKLVLGGLM